MDNFRIDVTSEGREHFDAAMKMAFSSAPGGTAVAIAVHSKIGLVLYWHAEKPARLKQQVPWSSQHTGEQRAEMERLAEAEAVAVAPLPFPLTATAAADYVWHWLTTAAGYGRAPDHDGDNEKGWRVYNEQWGHVAGNHYAFVAVQPVWAMYGK